MSLARGAAQTGLAHRARPKLTILKEQLGLLVIFDVVHLAVRLVGQVHPREVFVLAEYERESRLHPATREQAILDGALAFEEVAQFGGADAEAELGDCSVRVLMGQGQRRVGGCSMRSSGSYRSW